MKVKILCLILLLTVYSNGYANQVIRFCYTGIGDVKWSPDGNYFAFQHYDGIGIYTKTFQPYKVFEETRKFIGTGDDDYFSCTGQGIAWNQASTQLVVSYYGSDATPKSMWLAVWDINENKIVQQLRIDGYDNKSVTWSPDDTKIATASRDQYSRIWSVRIWLSSSESGFNLNHHINIGYTDIPINSIAWSSDSNLMLIAREDGVIQIWDTRSSQLKEIINSSEEITSDNLLLNQYAYSSGINTLAWTNDMNYFLTGSDDGFVTLWDRYTGIHLLNFESKSSVNVIDLAPQTSLVAIGNNDGTVQLWNIQTNISFDFPMTHKYSILGLDWNIDNRYIVTSSADNTIRLWDAEELNIDK